jgi:hypothetical protein
MKSKVPRCPIARYVNVADEYTFWCEKHKKWHKVFD